MKSTQNGYKCRYSPAMLWGGFVKKFKIIEPQAASCGGQLDEDGRLKLLPGMQLLRNVTVGVRVNLQEQPGSVVMGINFYDDDRDVGDMTRTFWFEPALKAGLFDEYAVSLEALLSVSDRRGPDIVNFLEEAIADLVEVRMEMDQEEFPDGDDPLRRIRRLVVILDFGKAGNPQPDIEKVFEGRELRRLLSFMEITRPVEFLKYYRRKSGESE